MSLLDTFVNGVRRWTGMQSEFRRVLDDAIGRLEFARVVEADDQSILLGIPSRGYYLSLFCIDGESVHYRVYSNIEFPLRCIPEVPCRVAAELNEDLDHCDYDVVHLRRSSKFIVKAKSRLMSVTPQFLMNALAVLVARMERFDEGLVEHGYAR